LCDTAIRTIFRTVIIAKLTYAAPGEASPKPPIVSVLTLSFAGQNVAATMTLIYHCLMTCNDNADEQLFDNVRRNSHHTLHNLLPTESLASENYSLRSRAHNRQLPEHQNILIISITVNLLSVCFIKTCTNPVLLTISTRFLSYHFIVVLYIH